MYVPKPFISSKTPNGIPISNAQDTMDAIKDEII